MSRYLLCGVGVLPSVAPSEASNAVLSALLVLLFGAVLHIERRVSTLAGACEARHKEE